MAGKGLCYVVQISVLLSRHELCRIYALFWSDFDADIVQISA